MPSLFQRASQRLPLTPAERAFLRTLKSLMIGAVLIAFQTAMQYLAAPGKLNLQQIISESILVGIFSLAHGILKYVNANGDAAFKMLGTVADQELSNVEHMFLDGSKGTLSMSAA